MHNGIKLEKNMKPV